MSDEEGVPRFGLRRGARFLQSLRREETTEDADEEWLAHLGREAGDGRASEEPSQRDGGDQGEVPAPVTAAVLSLSDAMATLEERLASLEEALMRATAACTVSRLFVREVQNAAVAPSPEPEGPPAAAPSPEPEGPPAAAPSPEPEGQAAVAPSPEPEGPPAAAPSPEPEGPPAGAPAPAGEAPSPPAGDEAPSQPSLASDAHRRWGMPRPGPAGTG